MGVWGRGRTMIELRVWDEEVGCGCGGGGL